MLSEGTNQDILLRLKLLVWSGLSPSFKWTILNQQVNSFSSTYTDKSPISTQFLTHTLKIPSLFCQWVVIMAGEIVSKEMMEHLESIINRLAN